MKSSILIIGNPIAGSYAKEKIEKAKKLLISSGISVDLFLTEKKGDAEKKAGDALKEKQTMILVAGGDGTINEVINGAANSEIPIGILPLGTTNVLAHEIGIPKDFKKAIDLIKTGTAHKISLGKISKENSNMSRYFILMTGIGFDGYTVYNISDRLKKISGKSAYIFSGLKKLLTYNPDQLRFTINDKQFDGYGAVVCNASSYGGGFKVTPDASLENPDLYIFIFKGRRRIELLKYVLGIIMGIHLKLKDIIYQKCNDIVVDGKAHVQYDGDYFGRCPVKISIVPNTLRLIY